MVLLQRWIFARPFHGVPVKEDFSLSAVIDIGPLGPNEIAFEAQFLSVDPYMIGAAAHGLRPGVDTMLGRAVVKVTESTDPAFPVGCHAVAECGWTKMGKMSTAGGGVGGGQTSPSILPAADIGSLSPSVLLGAAGMPGVTAYFGLLELCEPKPGETVLVNGAGGAVGGLVGQIAKIKGCRVIGLAGSDEKVAMVKNELGFDAAFNYKKVTTKAALDEAAPDGVDCFYDNVGGADTSYILTRMNKFGRVAICGAIATYSADPSKPPMVPAVTGSMIYKNIRMIGFDVWSRWSDRWNEGVQAMAGYIAEGKIKAKETVVDGFENMPEAFIGLFSGKNTGKMVVKA